MCTTWACVFKRHQVCVCAWNSLFIQQLRTCPIFHSRIHRARTFLQLSFVYYIFLVNNSLKFIWLLICFIVIFVAGELLIASPPKKKKRNGLCRLTFPWVSPLWTTATKKFKKHNVCKARKTALEINISAAHDEQPHCSLFIQPRPLIPRIPSIISRVEWCLLWNASRGYI